MTQRDAAPGTRFNYASPLTNALMMAAEHALEAPILDLLERRLFQRIGAESVGWFNTDGGGFPIAEGQLSLTLADFARWASVMINDGRNLAGQRIVPTAFIAETVRAEPGLPRRVQRRRTFRSLSARALPESVLDHGAAAAPVHDARYPRPVRLVRSPERTDDHRLRLVPRRHVAAADACATRFVAPDRRRAARIGSADERAVEDRASIDRSSTRLRLIGRATAVRCAGHARAIPGRSIGAIHGASRSGAPNRRRST